jgi:hypothetical protein
MRLGALEGSKTMRSVFVLVLLLPLLAGCGGSSNFVPVSGRVTLNGKPLANVAVVFSPVGSRGNNDPGPSSGGVTDSDGRYTLTVTGRNTNGAVVGKHKVKFSPSQKDDSASDRSTKYKSPLPGKYARKLLEYDVPTGGTDKADFELK